MYKVRFVQEICLLLERAKQTVTLEYVKKVGFRRKGEMRS
jgi:hypothetical protein